MTNYAKKVHIVFQSTPYALPVGETVKLWTPGNDGICFAPLTKGEEYYLGGIYFIQYFRCTSQ